MKNKSIRCLYLILLICIALKTAVFFTLPAFAEEAGNDGISGFESEVRDFFNSIPDDLSSGTGFNELDEGEVSNETLEQFIEITDPENCERGRSICRQEG